MTPIGSEQISTRWVEGTDRTCRRCGVKITNLKNVGEVRSKYPGPKRDLLCLRCVGERGAELLAETRARLGL